MEHSICPKQNYCHDVACSNKQALTQQTIISADTSYLADLYAIHTTQIKFFINALV